VKLRKNLMVSDGWDFAHAQGMSPRESFGPNLRRIRLQRGVSLEALTRSTNVGMALWQGLERNDLGRWPKGIYARGYVREYALAIGEDPEAVVDEFCRCFPEGEQRVVAPIHEPERVAVHGSPWRDELARMLEGDREPSPSAFVRLRRVFRLA
jgi:transcriptional regulator with XRE-family HTH domain